jgi:hypothetical protein
MTELDVTVRHSSGATEPLTLMVSRMVNCGRAWRDPPDESRQEAWTKQLNESGLSRQESEPFVFPKPPNLITTDDEIWVNSRRTYGKAEFVMFPTSDAVYVAVGVDTKYGDAMEIDANVGNSTCQSVISDDVWILDDVRDHWDDIELRSWTGDAGDWVPYQRATLSEFLTPETFLDRVDEKITGRIERTAIWSSTVGTVDDQVRGVNPYPSVRESKFYAAQLYDPVANRRLVTQFDVRRNDWVAGVDL